MNARIKEARGSLFASISWGFEQLLIGLDIEEKVRKKLFKNLGRLPFQTACHLIGGHWCFPLLIINITLFVLGMVAGYFSGNLTETIVILMLSTVNTFGLRVALGIRAVAFLGIGFIALVITSLGLKPSLNIADNILTWLTKTGKMVGGSVISLVNVVLPEGHKISGAAKTTTEYKEVFDTTKLEEAWKTITAFHGALLSAVTNFILVQVMWIFVFIFLRPNMAADSYRNNPVWLFVTFVVFAAISAVIIASPFKKIINSGSAAGVNP